MLRTLIALATVTQIVAAIPKPEWIWSGPQADQEIRYFRKSFQAPPGVNKVSVIVAADNQAELNLDDRHQIKNNLWDQPTRGNLPGNFPPGPHLIQVKARNAAGAAGLLVRLEMIQTNGLSQVVVSDGTWETSANGTDGWKPATSLGPVGVAPWGQVPLAPQPPAASSLKTLTNFGVDLIRSADLGEGSWISMTTDPKGRLLISPQGTEPILRLSLDPSGGGARIEPLTTPLRAAMGLLAISNVLYANAHGPEGYQMYRATDTDGDDQYDRVEVLHRWSPQDKNGAPGEHGAHAIVQGPDGNLYVVAGNMVQVDPQLPGRSPVQHFANDSVLPPVSDGSRPKPGLTPPGGHVLRISPDGQQVALFAAGQRNAYDIAFNADGELFAFDSDSEGDWGVPWYRPNRLLHLVSGVDHGYRDWSLKWPEYYADSLPAVVDAGLGSPSGLISAKGAKFPDRYQRAMIGLDWTMGRILVFHLQPKGSSYTGTFETLVRGRPLNVTDAVIGPEGALYFITGGRGIPSGLYRVRYTGSESTEPKSLSIAVMTPEKTARMERRRLEGFHPPAAPGTVESIWPALGQDDATVRHAARVALEAIPAAQWREKALSETQSRTGLTACLALARVGSREDQGPLLQSLSRWTLSSLDETDYLIKLRVIGVSFSRHGIPDAIRPRALEKLSTQFPTGSKAKDLELLALLAALNAPDVVAKTLPLRDAAATQEDQMAYQAPLRVVTAGWTPELRQRYFQWFGRPKEDPMANRSTAFPHQMIQWFTQVGLKPSSGYSFDNYIRYLRQDAFEKVPDDQKAALAGMMSQQKLPQTKARFREKIRDWTVADLQPALGQLGKGRDFLQGQTVYQEARCDACHRFDGVGGSTGPDLTGAGSRYGSADLLRSILEPDSSVPPQYQTQVITLKSGDVITGAVAGETPEALEVVVNPLASRPTRVLKVDIRDRAASTVSPMPGGLLNHFSQEEILDLLAFLQSGGNPDLPAFRK